MKIGTRMTSAALLVSLLAAGLLSCADADAGTQETQQTPPIETEPVTEAVTEDPALRDSLPEVDLGGYQYRMAIFGTDIQRIMTYNDDEDGNIVNDAVYHKIRTVEERFNTDIVLSELSYQEEDQIAALKNAVIAGDDTCEIAQGHDVNTANVSLEGLFVNIYDIPHLDFSKPWWPAATMESMTVAGQMYMMFNNISYSNLAQMRVMYFNKDLMQKLDFEYPYQMVYDGTWTLDAMKKITAECYHDLNGDGTEDVGDQYGYVNMPNYYGMLEPFCVEPYRKDNNGTLYYEVYLDKTQRIVEKFYDLIFGTGGFLMKKVDGYADIVLKMFSEGRSMFFYGSLDNAVSHFSNSDVVYGVLPMPKLDETQDDYYGGSFDRPLVVPTTAQNLENLGIVTEALNAEGYKQVYPAFYEIAMKTRYADQTDDAKMIDIVHDNVIISFTYLFGDYKSIFNMMWDLFNGSKPTADVASWCAKNEKAQTKRVEKLMTFFEEHRS